jgi:arginyl-tRNA synthetase
MHFLDHIEQICKNAALSLYPGVDLTKATITLNADPARAAFGDISFNGPLIIASATASKPRDVAATLVSAIIDPLIGQVEIAGPGFLNIRLSPIAYEQMCRELTKNVAAVLQPKPGTSHRYSLEYVSANPTGPLHIGHGRGGIIGDTLARVLVFIGHTVDREFYINDAGSQIGKLGESLRARYIEALGGEATIPEEGYHGEYLVTIAHQCVELYGATWIDKPASFFADYAKNMLLEAIKKTLHDYGVDFDTWFSEKRLHTDGSIDRVLTQLAKSGHLYEKDGALWFAATQFGDDKDRVVRRAQGDLTYVAADIAYLENKLERGFDRLVMVLGQDHHGYVSRLKAALAALGKSPQLLDVILYQLVTITDNGELVRLSKRAGKIVSLADVTETVGRDVARFFYLHRKADAQLDFDLALALKKTDENPVYYIQYAYVRTGSMLEKGATLGLVPTVEYADELTPAEHLLLKKILSLRELLRSITTSYQVHQISYYVIELASLFHQYYATNRVIDTNSPRTSASRLMIVSFVRDTIGLCLDLLGLEKPARM